MPDAIIDGYGSGYPVKVVSGGALLTTGSVNVTVTSEPVAFDSHEQIIGLAGSPSVNTLIFTSGTVKTISIQCSEDTYVDFDKTATSDSVLLTGFQPYNADFIVGSVSVLFKSELGSVWVWGGR